MTKTPHFLSSILIIPILLLPIIYVLGVLLPIALNDLCTQVFGDCSSFFTVLGIIFLISVLGPPPPSKRKLDSFKKAMKSFFRNLIKSKPGEGTVLEDNITFITENEHVSNSNIARFDKENEILRYIKAKNLNHFTYTPLIFQPALKNALNHLDAQPHYFLNLIYSLKYYFLAITWGEFQPLGGVKENSHIISDFNTDFFSHCKNFLRGNYIG